MSKLAEYEQELERARTRHAEVVSQIKILQQENAELGGVVMGWEAIVARERKENGQPGSPPPSPQSAGDEEDFEDFHDSTDTPNVAEGDEEEEGTNMTQFVRDFIKQRGGIGTSPDDLKQAAKANGLTHPASWPYGPIQRLKKKGDIVKRRGKFYPKIVNAAA